MPRRKGRCVKAGRKQSNLIHRLEPPEWPSRSQRGVVPLIGKRAALAIERHASFAPTARHAALRTRACGAAQPTTAQPRDRRRPATASTRTRSHPPNRPDARCKHRCTAAGHQRPRSPDNAKRSRSRRRTKADHHHPGHQMRTWSVAALNAQTVEAPRTRPATRPGLALCAPVPRRQPRALGREHDRTPPPPLARRNRRR